ncbi:hypothetical protein [Mucilaginibacter sp.]|uniref:hypothetical protein n=1 Tax=Mucilaginibacter sp. TaxID=1882438 RepID=UPI0035BC12A0
MKIGIFVLLLSLPIIALAQKAEIYISKEYQQNGKLQTYIFKLDLFGKKGSLTLYFLTGDEFKIDSLEPAGNICPIIRISDRKILRAFNKIIKQPSEYEYENNKVLNCPLTSLPQLKIYIKKGNVVNQIQLNDYGKCSVFKYRTNAKGIISLFNITVAMLNSYSPG